MSGVKGKELDAIVVVVVQAGSTQGPNVVLLLGQEERKDKSRSEKEQQNVKRGLAQMEGQRSEAEAIEEATLILKQIKSTVWFESIRT